MFIGWLRNRYVLTTVFYVSIACLPVIGQFEELSLSSFVRCVSVYRFCQMGTRWQRMRVIWIAVLFAFSPYVKSSEESRNWAALRDEPIQLVKPDFTHKNLTLISENVKMLMAVDKPVAIVAVVGKFHSGKSFLMNQLMRKSAGFGIGPSVKPQTMGIWMWGKPLEVTSSSGQEIAIIFLDTEGFAANNVSESYDSKIFAVATLMSSYLIYNSVKIIDQSDIDYLELLARRTQLFALRSQLSKAKWNDDINHDLLSFPPLLWIVQDFVQSTENLSPKEWLEKLMNSHTRENDEYAIGISDIFRSVDCHTLFLPATTKRLLVDLSQAREYQLTEEYREERDVIISKIHNLVKPKEKNGKPLTGPEIATLLEILVTAANEGSLAEVPTRWTSFIQHLRDTATEDCLLFYESEMNLIQERNGNKPINPGKLTSWHESVKTKALHLLDHLLLGLHDAIQESKSALSASVSQIYERVSDLNEKKIKLHCTSAQQKIQMELEDDYAKVQVPMKTSALSKIINAKTSSALTTFSDTVSHLLSNDTLTGQMKFLKDTLSNTGAALYLKNDKAIENLLNDMLKTSIDVFNEATKPIELCTPSKLERILNNGFKTAVMNFDGKTLLAIDEKLFKPYHAMLVKELQVRVKDLQEAHGKLVQEHTQKQVENLDAEFKHASSNSQMPLPMEESDLMVKLLAQMAICVTRYKQAMEDYTTYPVYNRGLQELKQKLEAAKSLRKAENVAAFAREVSGPLNTAKKIVILTADKYTSAFSVKMFIQNVCLLNLNEGVPKTWPESLKLNIIEHFIRTDPDIKKIIASYSGWWPYLLGWFQWFLWLVNLA